MIIHLLHSVPEILEHGVEGLVLFTPEWTASGSDNSVANISLSAELSVQFHYKPNPVISEVQFRNITIA